MIVMCVGGHKGDDVYARLGVLDYSRSAMALLCTFTTTVRATTTGGSDEFDLSFGKYGWKLSTAILPGWVSSPEGACEPPPVYNSQQNTGHWKVGIGAIWAGDLRRDSKDTGYTV